MALPVASNGFIPLETAIKSALAYESQHDNWKLHVSYIPSEAIYLNRELYDERELNRTTRRKVQSMATIALGVAGKGPIEAFKVSIHTFLV